MVAFAVGCQDDVVRSDWKQAVSRVCERETGLTLLGTAAISLACRHHFVGWHAVSPNGMVNVRASDTGQGLYLDDSSGLSIPA